MDSTLEIFAPARLDSRTQVTASEKTHTLVRDAHKTIEALGHGRLATIMETLMEMPLLLNAREYHYLLAVDSKDLVDFGGLPLTEGWYLFDRKNACFRPIDEKKADSKINDAHWYDVLYVSKGAARAAAAMKKRPIALDTFCYGNGGKYLYVDDWPFGVAFAAIFDETIAPQTQQRKMLRKRGTSSMVSP